MTSWNGIIFRVTDHLCGEFTGPRWIPQTKGQWRGALMFSLICVWINDWVNNREAGDLRRYRAHYDVIVMPACPCPMFDVIASITIRCSMWYAIYALRAERQFCCCITAASTAYTLSRVCSIHSILNIYIYNFDKILLSGIIRSLFQ